jgi:predicted ATPase
MSISKFSINNYKSFLKSGEIILKPGINIITGQNNAGKTALLQALGLSFQNNPHKSLITSPEPDYPLNKTSSVTLEFEISKKDIEDFVFTLSQVVIPMSERFTPGTNFNGRVLFERLEESNTLVTTYSDGKITNSKLLSLGTTFTDKCFILNVFPSSRTLTQVSGVSAVQSITLFDQLAKLCIDNIYYFQAERITKGSYTVGVNSKLKSDASNLAEVLLDLQSSRVKFEKYNKYVQKIFPKIYEISLNNIVNNQVEILVWNEDPLKDRKDLAVPLSNCGTGIGQVLAILYVILTATKPTAILIDEPNSFLHPGAARKLMEIFKDEAKHQFIITTHSPEIISAANPKTISLLKLEGLESKITQVDFNEAKNQRIYLAEVGAKLSDVFGADNILWVEGKTEELCFPKIIEKMGLHQMGTAILPVIHTGDLEGKHSDIIFDIYDKLSKASSSLIPPAIGFIFDKEDRSETKMNDLKRKSKSIVVFTKRKMFENYLIFPKAIHALLKGIPITEEKITKWIEVNKWNSKFIDEKYIETKKEEDWLLYVNGAYFLDRLFSELSVNTIAFNKIDHSIKLAEWVIENSFEDLKDYQDILSSILNKITK